VDSTEEMEEQFNRAAAYEGEDIGQDLAKAVEGWLKAAEQGDAIAQYNLGICYINGNGVEQDPVRAFEWFRKGAEQGDTDAQFCLAICYDKGEGVAKDHTKAFEWWYQLAEQGDANAQYNLGVCYARGEGVRKNLAKAVLWYRRAMLQGHIKAERAIWKAGQKLIRTKKWRHNDPQRETFYQHIANAVSELPEREQYLLKLHYGMEDDPVDTIAQFRHAAKAGDAVAQYFLGMCYEIGKGVTQDLAQAVEWYRQAAEQGNADAQEALGEQYAK